MTIGVVSEIICDDPKIIEHRTFDIGFQANRYRWDCSNKCHADIFYIDGSDEKTWLQDKRSFLKALFKEDKNA